MPTNTIVPLLFNALAGKVALPKTLYMGLMLAGVEVGADGGYARKAILTSDLLVNMNGIGPPSDNYDQLNIPTQVWTFTAAPNPPQADQWFLSDNNVRQATVGQTLAFGRLNIAIVNGVLTLAAGSNGSIYTVPTQIGSRLFAGDRLSLLTPYDITTNLPIITAVGPDNGGATQITLDAQYHFAANTQRFWRVGGLRTYSAGFTETVDAYINLLPMLYPAP